MYQKFLRMYMGEKRRSKEEENKDLIDVLENPESIGQHPFQAVYRPEFCMVRGHEVNLLQFDMKPIIFILSGITNKMVLPILR